jgi:hypothetical protein
MDNRNIRAAATPGSLLLAAAACLVVPALMPAPAQAQDGSALFAVGESGTRKGVRAATAPLQVPPAPAAAAVEKKPVEKPVAGRASRGAKAAKGAAGPFALNGRWEDSQCIPLTGLMHQPQLYIKRQYEFADKRKTWQLNAAVHNSPDCAAGTRLLTYQGSGTFAVAGKSAGAGDAYETSFKIERWSAVPETRDGVLTLLNGRCGSGDFDKGRRLDLSLTGCPALGIRSIAQAAREVELVRVANGKVFLGSSSFVPGSSDARQAQLSGYGVSRIP